MEAHDRLALLAQRASPDILTKTFDVMRGHVQSGRISTADLDHLDRAIADLDKHGTMTAMVERGWQMLRERVQDPSLSARIEALETRVARGACSGGEVSTATFAFVDESFLILVDHGLAGLTWLGAQLSALTSASPTQIMQPTTRVPATAAARALRLGVAYTSLGGRAGVLPPMMLPSADLRLAGALVAQIDIFVMAHELAHVLLGHIGSGSRVGIVGGTSELLGKVSDQEFEADRLAAALVFSDAADEIDATLAELRLSAIRLFFELIEIYERGRFVIQPSSHPPARARWARLRAAALDDWFENLDALVLVCEPLLASFGQLATDPEDLASDAEIVEHELAAVIDSTVWDVDRWRDTARLNSLVAPAGVSATAALLAWDGWQTGAVAELPALVDRVIGSEIVRGVVAKAIAGEDVLTRIDMVDVVARAAAPYVPESDRTDLFPFWALSALISDLLQHGHRSPAHGGDQTGAAPLSRRRIQT